MTHPAGRREAAPADEPGPDRPVARPELLPPERPDLLLGLDSDPPTRNIFGLIAADPELARGGIRLRQFGQEIIEHLGGKKIHPGLVASPAACASRSTRGAARPYPRLRCPRRSATAHDRPRPLQGAARSAPRGESRPSAISRRCSWAWCARDGTWEHYDGRIRFGDAQGRSSPTSLDPRRYRDFIGEAVEPDSYPEVAVLQADGLPRGHLPRRSAGAAQHLHADGQRRWPTRSWRSTASAAAAR